MIFDQYSRYKACADLLRQVGLVDGQRLLDVGSGPECLLGRFIPNKDVIYLDPLITSLPGEGRISGDIFSVELDGRLFDFVSAIDVLEHVPPEQRQKFLARMTSLSSKSLILGFPCADATDAALVDKAIDDKYRTVFGRHYSWLEEHFRYGLPSLEETKIELERLGWFCNTLGHAHAPWIKELLDFVICTWDAPQMRGLVMDLSEEFNRELYSCDFRPPFYRQFIVASRKPFPELVAPKAQRSQKSSDKIFRTLLQNAQAHYFSLSLKTITDQDQAEVTLRSKLEEASSWGISSQQIVLERDNQIGALSLKLEEVSNWGQTSQAALVERDKQIGALSLKLEEVSNWGQASQAALVERDKQIGELILKLDLMINSSSWRLTRPLRFLARLLRHGLLAEDRQKISHRLRQVYHALPLPQWTKRSVRYVYNALFRPSTVGMQIANSSVAVTDLPKEKNIIEQTDVPDYVVWGIIDWHFRHQRPQQLAKGLAKTGRRVFYISPNFVDDASNGFRVEPLNDEGNLFQINLFLKRAPRIYFEAPSPEYIMQLRGSFGEMLTWTESQQIVSLIEHPFWFPVASVLPNSRLVYDCMDHHEGFGNNAEPLMQIEREMLRQSELTITTSQWLDDAIAPFAKTRTLIRNAAEYEHFAEPPAEAYRDPQGRRVIGYYGAIAEWFDCDLVEAVARRHPECSVLLIGADTVHAKERLADTPNVAFTGEMPYDRLPFYLHGFDICLLPFKVIPLTLATNPVKAYEYLSAGKPVVAVDLPEMKQFDGLLYVAQDAVTFVDAVTNLLEQPEQTEIFQRRQAFAAGQTWVHRCKTLISVVETSSRDPWVSIIVVSYNNLDFTSACLHSLEKHSQYVNCEIIVVDNASTDGTPKYLQEWASSGQGVRRCVLNENNRGFAAANNQGLAIASGDYLVLLNNDTYVTTGWIRTLMGHLQRDQTIGLIGPVTNNIGNEAKIDINYSDMNEMQINAASYTRRHVGQIYPLETAAFFCVMMPKTTYEKVGLLDETFGLGFFEDDDYCRRIEKIGLRIGCADDVFIHHHLSASFGKIKNVDREALMQRNKAIYEKKWGMWKPHAYRSLT